MSTYEVKSEVTGSIWKILASVGQQVSAEEPIMIVESMKMEIPVILEDGGKVTEFRVAEGDSVSEGQIIAVIDI